MIETVNKLSRVNFGDCAAVSSFSSTPRPRPSPDRRRPSHLASTPGHHLLPPPPAVKRVPSSSSATTTSPVTVLVDQSPLSPVRRRLNDWPAINATGSPESHSDHQGGTVVGGDDVPFQSQDRSAIDECYVNDVGRTAFDHFRLAVARNRVTSGGFYHGPLTVADARRLLTDRPVGTFLLRDSSDRVRYPFAVSVRIASTGSAGASAVTSIRIVYEAGRFRFDGVPESVERLPTFDCVVQLIRHHIEDSKRGAPFDGSRDDVRSGGVIAFVGRTSTMETTLLPVVLKRPLPVISAPSTLKHICRRSVSTLLGGRDVFRLQLQPSLRQYLLDYPYDV